MSKRVTVTIIAIIILGGCKATVNAPPRTDDALTLASGRTSHLVATAVAQKIAERSEPEPCPDEADTAAMLKLYPTLGNIDETSPRSLTLAEKSIACLRPWAEAIKDPCQQAGMLNWLDHYEGQVKKAREELANGNTESSLDKALREWRAKEYKARDWERKHPFPKMPQCESR